EEAFEQRPGMDVALTSLAGSQVILQVRVARDEILRPERRASEVGVEDDSGGVDDWPQRWLRQLGEAVPGLQLGRHRVGGGPDRWPGIIEGAPDLGGDEMARIFGLERGEPPQRLVYGGKLTQLFGFSQS